MKKREIGSVVGVGVLAFRVLGAGAGEAASEDRIVVRDEARGFSVRAQRVSAVEALRAVGAKAGFTVVDRSGGQSPVTVVVEGMPLETILKVLLRDVDHVIVYGPGLGPASAPRIKEIRVLGSMRVGSSESRPGQSSPGAEPASTGRPEAAAAAAPQGPRPPEDPPATPQRTTTAAALEEGGETGSIPESLRQHLLGQLRSLIDATRQVTLDR